MSEVFLPLVAHLTLFALLLTLAWSAVPPQVLAWRRNLQPRGTALMTRATMLTLGLAWGVGAAFVFRSSR